MNPNTEPNTNVSAIRELNNLIKTDALLLRDLPLVVNLSKYFDMSKLDPDGTALRSWDRLVALLSLTINQNFILI